MLSVVTITLAFMIGIAWGLYLESLILVIALIFLLLIMLIFSLKSIIRAESFNKSIILAMFVLIGNFYTLYKGNFFENKYIEGEFGDNLKITSHYNETKYYYKYNAKNERGDRFIVYLKKKEENKFKIGTKLSILGEFEFVNTMRNSRAVLIIACILDLIIYME